MRYKKFSTDFFKRNRRKLSSDMEGSLAVLFSNPIQNYNADSSYPFVQNSDFFYFTGIEQSQCILILFPDSIEKSNREILFIKKTDTKTRIWEGELLSEDQAKSISGIENISFIEEFDFYFNLLRAGVKQKVYLGCRDLKGDTINNNYRELMENYPFLDFDLLSKLSNPLRVVKEDEELKYIKEAIQITKIGLNELRNTDIQNLYEYQVESILTAAYLRNKSRRHAFLPIVAGGKNATILHYINNDNKLNPGDLVLIDTGAEYGNYNADITRVYPVSGKFGSRQKDVYLSVLSCLEMSMNEVKPGISLKELNDKIALYVKRELKYLGLINTTLNNDFKQYYMHSGSHFLGLDVHDVGGRDTVLKPGMVITIEPGIYIRDEGIGIRLENDVLVTERGFNNLSAEIPIQINDIEQ